MHLRSVSVARAGKKRIPESLLELVWTGSIAFLFLFQSPVNIWKTSAVGTDSSVFKTVSMMMKHGLMPYRDSFDHKGPLLYCLNALADRLADYRGIWAVELVFLTVTFWLIYRIARLSCSRIQSAVSLFVSLSLLFPSFEGGNLSEEYAMVFIAAALYIFLDYLISGTLSRGRLFVCGACLGAVLLLRPNMIAAWAVFSLAVLYKTVREHRAKELLYFLFWFLAGLGLILLPFVIWLAYKDSLKWCWKVYVDFNRAYISEEGGRALFRTKWSCFFTLFNSAVYLIAFSVQVYLCAKRRTVTEYAYLCYLFVSVLLNCLSGVIYAHYGMVLVPALVYPISQLFALVDEVRADMDLKKLLTFLLSAGLICLVVLPDWLTLIGTLPTVYDHREKEQFSDTERHVVYLVQSHTKADEPISVYGNWDIIYVLSKRLHATRYSYQFPVGTVMPEILDEYFAALRETAPDIIVVQQGYYDERIRSFLKENRYRMIWSEAAEPQNGAIVFSAGAA